MKRFEDWPTRLDEFIDSRRNAPFAWGSNDCCLFACDAVLAMTGEDLAADFRGKYSDARGAIHVLRDFLKGIGDDAPLIEALAVHIARIREIKEIAPRFAQRGDVVLFEDAHGETLGLVSLAGDDILAPGESELVRIPISSVLRAWRI
ncbi:MAG TPA: hypothetical protein VFB23_00890 [Candidatus Acidoferrales bacterium]|nr:hypothetical protein [Candidatus Acidoferrales bacterium]